MGITTASILECFILRHNLMSYILSRIYLTMFGSQRRNRSIGVLFFPLVMIVGTNITSQLLSVSYYDQTHFERIEIATNSNPEGILGESLNTIGKILPSNQNQFKTLNTELFTNLNLSVRLDEALSVIEGNLSVDYLNTKPFTFNRIPFHLYPSGMDYETRPGEIRVLDVTTTDIPTENLEFSVSLNKQLLWVNLPTPLGFNERTSFQIAFNTTLPDGQDRANSNGFDSNQSRIYTCTAFYPIPCVYDKYDGWNTDDYLPIGDPFYFDMAYYDLFIDVPNDMIIVATGKLLDTNRGESSTLYHYNPFYPVREVVFSASRYFLMESGSLNGINVSCYYLPHSTSLWEDSALNTTINSLLLFNNSFGSYPYSTFNVVEAYGFYGGMEYPCQVQISESIRTQHPDNYEFYQEMVIAHEVAHQWWCQMVGNDQIDWGHLDEGLTCWSTDYYFDQYYPSWHYFDDYWALDTVRTYYENTGLPSKVNQSIYDFLNTNLSYRFTAYTKTPLLLQKLRLTIGQDNFMAGLRHFFQNYQFKLARFPDLQNSFENMTGKGLDWYFFPWFDNPYLPSYYYKNMDYDSNTGTITVTIGDLNEDKNEYPYSQHLYLQVMDYQQEEIFHRERVWINGTTTVTLVVSEKDNPGTVLLMYESDILVQLWSDDVTALTFKTDSWFKTDLIELIEFSVFLITLCVLSGYVVWGIKNRKFPKKR